MTLRNTDTTYGSVAKFFHWVIAILIIVMLCAGVSFGYLPDGPFKHQLVQLHKATGLTILTLVVLRLLWRITNIVPSLPASTPAWQRCAAHLVHGLLYLVSIVVPLSGWIMSTAGGHITSVFGLFTANAPWVGINPELGRLMSQFHHWGAWVIVALWVVHVGAALQHHFINKDDIVKRMLPGVKPLTEIRKKY